MCKLPICINLTKECSLIKLKESVYDENNGTDWKVCVLDLMIFLNNINHVHNIFIILK